jgi:copper chaperone CopZ
MRTTLVIDALQCYNCENFVTSILKSFDGLSNISVDIRTKSLSFDYKTHNTIEGLRIRLAEVGYPITYDPSVIKYPEEYIDINSDEEELLEE